jgi:uncharacterized metal-binding protein
LTAQEHIDRNRYIDHDQYVQTCKEEAPLNDAAAPTADPLVCACSGASNLGQLSNEIALRLDRAGLAEMSCAEAVGIEAGPPCEGTLSGRPVIAISGCPLACAGRLLKEHGVTVAYTVQLENRGVLKAKHVDVAAADEDRIYAEVVSELGV